MSPFSSLTIFPSSYTDIVSVSGFWTEKLIFTFFLYRFSATFLNFDRNRKNPLPLIFFFNLFLKHETRHPCTRAAYPDSCFADIESTSPKAGGRSVPSPEQPGFHRKAHRTIAQIYLQSLTNLSNVILHFLFYHKTEKDSLHFSRFFNDRKIVL